MSVRTCFIGRRRYDPVHSLQQDLATLRGDGHTRDVILLVEHEPVITLGRAAAASNVLLAADVLAKRGVDLVQTGRGGDVTYHGPGQLVCYPILDLKPDRCDVRRYVRQLAEAMILLARELGVEAGVVDNLIGVWVDRDKPTEWAGEPWSSDLAKLGAIGVRLSRWVTMHGFALNLSTNLAAFRMIIPCGITQYGVTSIEELTGSAPSVRDAALGIRGVLSRALEISVGPVEDLSQADDLLVELAGAEAARIARSGEARAEAP